METGRAPRRYRGGLLAAALVAVAAFVVLTMLVATHATQPWDSRAVAWFRPHDEWGRTQAVLEPVIDALEPSRVLALLVVVVAVVSFRSRSLRPAVLAGSMVLAAGLLTLVTKYVLHRPDPHADMSGVGGSYPSGHMAALVVCLGASLLVLRTTARWWHWPAVGLLAAAMAAALLFTAAHWATDVAGGTLVGVGVATAACAVPGRLACVEGAGGRRLRVRNRHDTG